MLNIELSVREYTRVNLNYKMEDIEVAFWVRKKYSTNIAVFSVN